MGSYDEVRGRICRDLASLSILFNLREAAFSTFSFWGRARMYVIFLVFGMFPSETLLVRISLDGPSRVQSIPRVSEKSAE